MMTGQVCMSVERVYVEEPVAEAFTQKLVERDARCATDENGRDAEIDLGPFTSPRQVEIVERHVADARRKGARVSAAAARRAATASTSSRRCSPASTTRWRSCARRRSGRSCPVMAVADAEEALGSRTRRATG
jgi:acyl-CoA reductase-like NAD-dependent aldehyde dehydrogenase